MSELFESFLKTFQDKNGNYRYRARISQLVASGGKSVLVDYDDLIQFNVDLAHQLLQEPDGSFEEFRTAAYETMSSENAPYADRVRKVLAVRIRGIQDRVPLRKVDTSYLDKLVAVSGMVVRTSELRPLLVDGAFVCPNGHLTMQLQDGLAIKRPVKCETCDETRNLELDQKKSAFIDSQMLRIQELPEELPPGQLPQFFDVDLQSETVNTARPGDRLVLTGVVRAEPDFAPGQGKMRLFRSKIECNYIEVIGKEPEQVQVSKEDELLIRSVVTSTDAYQKLISSIAPAIIGHEAVKEAILLLLAGGPQTTLPDGTKLRGDINVLLVGDPGVAKSEMLKFAAQVAPRGLFASGRGTTAAGLSAAVLREKNVLMLEAGVVVLADQGIAAIDEFDKMRPEDRSALHEQMEQQSYHPLTELILADGAKVKIGELVEKIFAERADSVVHGKNCEIVPLSGELALRSIAPTGNEFQAHVDRVSRHKAPRAFVRIRYSNGRSITVTPEHPVFVYKSDRITTVPASEVQSGDFAPAPISTQAPSTQPQLTLVGWRQGSKEVVQQQLISPELGRVLGHLVSEGNFYRGRTTEIDFTNLNQEILEDMQAHADSLFGITPINRTVAGQRVGLRYVSKTLLDWFQANFPEMVRKARDKRAPHKILGAPNEVVREFLATAYLGDGSVESNALCYRTSSEGLAEDYQDLMLRLGISSRIALDKSNDSFKVYVTGDALRRFFEKIVERFDPRYEEIRRMVQRSAEHERSHDSFPNEVIPALVSVRKRLGLSYDGRFWRHSKSGHGITRGALIKELSILRDRLAQVANVVSQRVALEVMRLEIGMSQQRLARLAGVRRGAIDYLEAGGYSEEKRAKLRERIEGAIVAELQSMRQDLTRIEGLMPFRFLRIRSVERVENAGRWKTRWAYDVTVEPTHNFISNGLILHNTVTIAKGGIYATLNARTSILAALNPILGKYNSYQNLTDNINLPIPLLTRFDLIFVIKDTPTAAQDERLAAHILEVHRKRGFPSPPPIHFDLLKKYFAYAKKTAPTLTKEAEERLKEYYLSLRRSVTEGQIGATPRTLESLIRLASARARILLRDQVIEDDALTAISLMNRMVEDVLTDTETKTRADFGVLLGKPTGERNKRVVAMDAFKTLEGTDKKPVERKALKEELMKTGRFNDEDAEKMIQNLIRDGTIYESPKPGFYRRLQS